MENTRTKREDKIIEMIEIIQKNQTPEPSKKMNAIIDLESDFEYEDDNSSINSYYSTQNV